jgi:hypothetical protein
LSKVAGYRVPSGMGTLLYLGSSRGVLYRYMLQHAHPAKFLAECLGSLCAGYFLWRRQWAWALGAGATFFVLSTVAVWRRPINHLSGTRLGRTFLAYATPVNFGLYNLSAVPITYGLWSQKVWAVMAGILVLLLPHLRERQNFDCGWLAAGRIEGEGPR